MTKILTNHIATMTGNCVSPTKCSSDPAANRWPSCATPPWWGILVPAEAVSDVQPRFASREEVLASAGVAPDHHSTGARLPERQMSFALLSVDLVVLIHEEILSANELQGLAADKSLDSALARIDNRLAFGMVDDIYSLAAAYAAAISQGHCFNDGNKRTAFQAMDIVLDLNGVAISLGCRGRLGPELSSWPSPELTSRRLRAGCGG